MSTKKQGRDAARAAAASSGLLINLSACKYPLVREAAERLGYSNAAEDECDLWDLFWSDLSVSPDRVQRLLPFQRLNHFPGMLEICRKGALSRHMARMAARYAAAAASSSSGSGSGAVSSSGAGGGPGAVAGSGSGGSGGLAVHAQRGEYGFYPPALLLPDQLDELVAALRRNKARAESGAGGPLTTYILKPSAGTQGRGISLVQLPCHLAEAGDVHGCVAQAYVGSPLLLDGCKFDLRVYAAVTSVDPLRIHLYDEGLARLATEPYAPPSPANLRATTMHLTNYALNKGAPGFMSADAAPAGGGHKRLMSSVLSSVAAAHGTTREALMGAIGDIVVKTVLAIQPLLAHTYHTCLPPAPTTAAAAAGSASASPAPQQARPCSTLRLDHVSPSDPDPTAPCACPPSLCFELLGFDVMLDAGLQPWLLEVNHSPSFAADSRLDRAVKGELLARTMLLLGQRPDARRAFLEAEARAQSERLYNAMPHTGYPTAYGGGGSTAAGRRALSALPRSRQLQATAEALDELAANSAALLAAGGHVWGGGGGGGAAPVRNTAASSSCGGGGSSSCSGGCGGGEEGVDATGARRTLSFGSGTASGDGGNGHASGRFTLIFPAPTDAQQRRYLRILQTAADIFPLQTRCQCAFCHRRREIALLSQSGAALGLAARPLSALGAPLSGHLPARPSFSARLHGHNHHHGLRSAARRRVAAAAAATAAGACGGASGSTIGEEGPGEADDSGGGGSDGEGRQPAALGGSGAGAAHIRPPAGAPAAEALRGRPPRPHGSARACAAHSRTDSGGAWATSAPAQAAGHALRSGGAAPAQLAPSALAAYAPGAWSSGGGSSSGVPAWRRASATAILGGPPVARTLSSESSLGSAAGDAAGCRAHAAAGPFPRGEAAGAAASAPPDDGAGAGGGDAAGATAGADGGDALQRARSASGGSGGGGGLLPSAARPLSSSSSHPPTRFHNAGQRLESANAGRPASRASASSGGRLLQHSPSPTPHHAAPPPTRHAADASGCALAEGVPLRSRPSNSTPLLARGSARRGGGGGGGGGGRGRGALATAAEGGGIEVGGEDSDSSGGVGDVHGTEVLRRSYSCSELEAAFRRLASSAADGSDRGMHAAPPSSTAAAAAEGTGFAALGAGAADARRRPWLAASSRGGGGGAGAPQLSDGEEGTGGTSADGGAAHGTDARGALRLAQTRSVGSARSTGAASHGAAPAAVAAPASTPWVPRVALLAPKRGPTHAMSAAELELLTIRMRTAAMMSNRYVGLGTIATKRS